MQACGSLLEYCPLYCEEALSICPLYCGSAFVMGFSWSSLLWLLSAKDNQLCAQFLLSFWNLKKNVFCYHKVGVKISAPTAFPFCFHLCFWLLLCTVLLKNPWPFLGPQIQLGIFCFLSLGTVMWTSNNTSSPGEQNVSRGQLTLFIYCSVIVWPKYMLPFASAACAKLPYNLKLVSVNTLDG